MPWSRIRHTALSNTTAGTTPKCGRDKGGYGASRRRGTGPGGGRCPRFTVLSRRETAELHEFFGGLALAAARVLVPGGHVLIASNPLLSTMTFHAFQAAGLDKRGEIIRLVQTLRGGDRPKGAEREFRDVTVMPRSCWEPWGIFRKPFEGTVAENLRRWGAGGLRRVSDNEPFRDVIPCSPARGKEKEIAPPPIVEAPEVPAADRAGRPCRSAWALSTIRSPEAVRRSPRRRAVGYRSIGTDRDPEYFEMGVKAFCGLAGLDAACAGTGLGVRFAIAADFNRARGCFGIGAEDVGKAMNAGKPRSIPGPVPAP